jgi:hypothetical protein
VPRPRVVSSIGVIGARGQDPGKGIQQGPRMTPPFIEDGAVRD